LGSQPVSPKRSNPAVYLKDAFFAITLVLALAVVYGLDRGRPSEVRKVDPPPLVVTKIENKPPEPPPMKPLRLAVTPPSFDDMGKLLDSMGKGFKYTTIKMDDLRDMKKLREFDVIFFTCGTIPDSWVARKLENSLRPGTIQVEAKQEVLREVAANLKNFVNNGGTLYASDRRLTHLGEAFPEFVNESQAHSGAVQSVSADVVDLGLVKLLGVNQITLNFDQQGWMPAAISGKGVEVYLKGRYHTMEGESRETPLLVKFPSEHGQVIFTSFHNEKQTSEIEQKLLKFLVFSVVTAKTESAVARTMVQGGFSPTSRDLLSASPQSPSVTQTYTCKKAGPLQFALGFENQGAQLKLTVTGPGGTEYEKEGSSTFVLEIPAATVGEWKYTVTAVKVPYENFPFTLTIGEK
jgi:hypothetical protein